MVFIKNRTKQKTPSALVCSRVHSNTQGSARDSPAGTCSGRTGHWVRLRFTVPAGPSSGSRPFHQCPPGGAERHIPSRDRRRSPCGPQRGGGASGGLAEPLGPDRAAEHRFAATGRGCEAAQTRGPVVWSGSRCCRRRRGKGHLSTALSFCIYEIASPCLREVCISSESVRQVRKLRPRSSRRCHLLGPATC